MRVPVLVAAAAVVAAGLIVMPAAAQNTGNTVNQETVAAGNEAFVYVPGGVDVGFRAASTPILLVLDDRKVDAARAEQIAESSGLAGIAEREQGVVAFLNPAGDTWQASDGKAVTDALSLFSDNTGAPYDQAGKQCAANPQTGETTCAYPGSRTRVYVFADRSAADFVNRTVVAGLPLTPPFPPAGGPPVVQTWTPAAVFSSNATSAVVAPPVDVEVPAFVVNGTAEIRSAYEALNSVHQLFGTGTAPAGSAFDADAVRTGYDRVIEHAIQRVSEVNPFMQVYRIPDYAAEGVEFTKKSQEINGAALEYFQYRPRPAPATMPLVLAFHGGGNHAEFQMWATGWPELAKREGFMVVSVNRHPERSAADVVALLDSLVDEFPDIDTSRVYATGFSLGSVKTWALGEEFTERFAAIAPTNGSLQVNPAATEPIPTIYFGGEKSPLPEFPHQTGEANDIDKRLEALFARNDVTGDYVFDAAKDEDWGIAPTSTFVAQDPEFPDVSVKVNRYASRDGKVITALGTVVNGSHEPLFVEAEVAWEFMSGFSR